MSEERWREEIDRAFVEGIDRARFDALRAHLLECDECRAYYDKLGEVDRALSPNRMREAIVSRVIGEPAPVLRIRWVAPVSIAVAVAASVMLFLMLQPKSEHFNVRGSGTPFKGRPPGIIAACVHKVGESVETAGANGLLVCSIDDAIQFAYSTPVEPRLFLMIFGEEEDGSVHWYAPRTQDAPLVATLADAVEAALPWSTELSVNHHPGKLRLRVRFLDRSMTAEEAMKIADPIAELALTLEVTPKK